jgi:hypothetical protein
MIKQNLDHRNIMALWGLVNTRIITDSTIAICDTYSGARIPKNQDSFDTFEVQAIQPFCSGRSTQEI